MVSVEQLLILQNPSQIVLTLGNFLQYTTPPHPGPYLPERVEDLGITGVAAGGGSGSPSMKTGLLGPTGAGLAPSSSDEKANLGIVSRLMVLRRDGLGPRSGWEEDEWQEEPEDIQDLSLSREEPKSCLPGGLTPGHPVIPSGHTLTLSLESGTICK